MLQEAALKLKSLGYVGIPEENLEVFLTNFEIEELDEKSLKLLENFFEDYHVLDNVSSLPTPDLKAQILEDIQKEADELLQLYKDVPRIKQEYIFSEIAELEKGKTQIEKLDKWFENSMSLSDVLLHHKLQSNQALNVIIAVGFVLMFVIALGVSNHDSRINSQRQEATEQPITAPTAPTFIF